MWYIISVLKQVGQYRVNYVRVCETNNKDQALNIFNQLSEQGESVKMETRKCTI